MSNNQPFKEILPGFMHSIFRAAGMTMLPGPAPERVREIGENMAKAIEHEARNQAVVVIKKLQASVTTAFVKIETVLNDTLGRLSTLTGVVDNLVRDQKLDHETLAQLRKRIAKLEQHNVSEGEGE